MTTPISNNNNNPSAAFPHPIDSPLPLPNILELLPSRLSCEQFVDAMRWLSGIARLYYGFTHQVMFAGLAARVFQESDPQKPVEAKLGAGEKLSDLAMGGVGMLWDHEDTIRVAAGKQDFDGIGEKWYGDDWDEDVEDEWEDDDEWDYDGDEDDDEFGGDDGDGEEDCWDDDEYCLEEENYLDEDEDDEDEDEDDEEDDSSQYDDEDDDGRGRRL